MASTPWPNETNSYAGRANGGTHFPMRVRGDILWELVNEEAVGIAC